MKWIFIEVSVKCLFYSKNKVVLPAHCMALDTPCCPSRRLLIARPSLMFGIGNSKVSFWPYLASLRVISTSTTCFPQNFLNTQSEAKRNNDVFT